MNFDTFNTDLRKYGVSIYLSRLAERDYKSFSSGKRNQILLLLFKQVKKGADFKPRGNENALYPPLHKFVKIKSKAITLRIIYRPVQREEMLELQIIAIGPRDKNKVYKKAQERLDTFFEEVKDRN